MPSVSSDRTIYTLFCFFTAPVYGDEQTQVDDYYGGEYYTSTLCQLLTNLRLCI